ncbi:MAG: methylated-DNA--[protein]-cysteine S-methyltransferase [Chloroflexota bacterium]
MSTMTLSRHEMTERMLASDRSADGCFMVGVKTTGIYCMPSCRPPRKPNPENCVFFASPEEARAAGFRACKLCKPDAAFLAITANNAGRAADTQPRTAPRIAYLDTIDEAPGPLAFAVAGDGALLRLQFLDGQYESTVEEELERDGFRAERDPGRTAQARGQLLEYCAGERRTFDLPLVLGGSEWQNTVWRTLTSIPFGETRTYGQIAAMLGRPAAARAVGRANATNPIPLVVPCHRVIGADGSLTGYGGGMHLKVRLLAHEGVRPTSGRDRPDQRTETRMDR